MSIYRRFSDNMIFADGELKEGKPSRRYNEKRKI